MEILRNEGDRLATMPVETIDAPVPAVEGWTVGRVLSHTGKVHQWVTAYLELGPGASLSDVGELPGMPRGTAALPAYREALDALLAAFELRDPSEPSQSFVGPADVSWWMRRQAQEVSVHRIDAADAVHAAGGATPDPLAVDGAADGVDEWATMSLERWVNANPLPDDLVGRTVHIHGTDDPAPSDGAEWLLTFDRDAVAVERTHAKGDVALRGPAADLLLTLWRRRPVASLDVVGDAAVAERLLDLVRL